MKRIVRYLLFVTMVVSLLVLGTVGCAQEPEEELPPVKIGVLRAFTGVIAQNCVPIGDALRLLGDEVNWEVAGRKIVLIEEDEAETPDVAVAKAKKLVEQDKVDVVIGPMLAHSAEAVEAYLMQKGVLHLPYGPSNEAVSKHLFTSSIGTARGDAYPSGLFAYDELGARKAALVYTDYLFGQQNRDGFVDAFTSRGGTIVLDIAVPWGTADMAPYIVKIREAGVDVISGFLVGPSDIALIKQGAEYGLDIPICLGSGLMQEEPVLAEIGEDAAGMYGALFYSPELDTPESEAYVNKFKEKYGYYPMCTATQGYNAMKVYLEALEATGGDTDPEKIAQAILEGEFTLPSGTITYTSGRTHIHDVYICKVVKKDRWCWDIVKVYRDVEPR